MKSLLRKILQILFEPHPEGTRYTIAFASILWGVLLLLSNEAYSIPLFRAMSTLMPEIAWGLMFVLHGILALFFLFSNKKNIWAFIFDVTYGMLLWTTATVSLIVSSVIIPAHLSAQIILSLCTLWLFIRFNLQKG